MPEKMVDVPIVMQHIVNIRTRHDMCEYTHCFSLVPFGGLYRSNGVLFRWYVAHGSILKGYVVGSTLQFVLRSRDGSQVSVDMNDTVNVKSANTEEDSTQTYNLTDSSSGSSRYVGVSYTAEDHDDYRSTVPMDIDDHGRQGGIRSDNANLSHEVKYMFEPHKNKATLILKEFGKCVQSDGKRWPNTVQPGSPSDPFDLKRE